MDTNKEKEIIYQLMRNLIEERRALSKQYMDLKVRLDSLDELHVSDSRNTDENYSTIDNEKESRFGVIPPYKKVKKEPIERIGGYVSEILRDASTPLKSKEIYESLVQKYEVQIQYLNFRNNILPRLAEMNQFSIEKAYRGYWQFRRETV